MSVNSYLESLASNLLIKDTEKEKIKKSIETLESRINTYPYWGAYIQTKFAFGSYTRDTVLTRKADENSDVDYMIVFNNANNYKPQTFLNYLKSFAEFYYQKSEIYQSSPSVVLELNHIKFDLVPAYEYNYLNVYKELKIPAPRNKTEDWITTNPNDFNKDLIEINKNNSYLIKPVIRVLKYWNSLNGKIFDSFELEQKIMRGNYFYISNLKDYFFAAVNNITYSIPIIPIDTYNKLNKLKEKVEEIKKAENDGYPYTAESKLKELLPEI